MKLKNKLHSTVHVAVTKLYMCMCASSVGCTTRGADAAFSKRGIRCIWARLADRRSTAGIPLERTTVNVRMRVEAEGEEGPVCPSR